jgi:cold shock CspA family protein
MATPDELVLIVPRDEVPGGLDFTGVVERPFASVLASIQGSGRFEPRGMVEKLFEDDGYGFIRSLDGARQFYFHRNSVLHDGFASLSVGTEVRFNPQEGEQGPQASSVQIVAKPGD